jgi:hypothetical protein
MNNLLTILIVVPLLMGLRSCSTAPSTFFHGLDENTDIKLSYPEWMAYYTLPMHEHSIEHCSRRDFYLADCDLDDHLTWKEYSDFRFKHKSCEAPAVMTVRKMYESDPELQTNPSRAAIKKLLSIQIEELAEREAHLMQSYKLTSN